MGGSKTLPATLQLEQRLDLTAAAPLHQALSAHRGASLSVDASQVQRVGGQCLQVLLSAVATWKADGVAVELVQPSPEFCDALAVLGIERADLMMEEVRA